MAELEYKVVETTLVTDESLEAILNEWVSQGWEFERVQFAMSEGSKRPAMAFVFFTRLARRPAGEGGGGLAPGQSSQSSISR